MKCFLLIGLFFFSINHTFSQSYQLIALDTISNGSLEVSLDETIDRYVSDSKQGNCEKLAALNRRIKANAVKKNTPISSCKETPQIIGYKIQIFYSKNRGNSNDEKNKFKEYFPSLEPELVYASPDYKVLVGDYLSKKSAASDLSKIKRKFPGSFVVQWRVWCRKAK